MKIAFWTLGCKVNSYETEAVWQLFKKEGFIRVHPSEIADVYIINTCTVTNTADAKSRQKIRQAIKLNPQAIIGVMGCYSQIKAEDVAKIEGVHIIIGNEEKSKIVDLVLKSLNERKQVIDVTNILKYKEYENLSAIEFEHTRAFLKIQDGCNNFCTYCIIPYARGPLRSKKHLEVISDVRRIVAMDYKEIVLAGIHTGGYKDGDYSFSDLVSDILKIDELKRLRISSMEIMHLDDKFLTLLKHEHLANHLHLPLQSGSEEILRLMNRKYTKNEFLNKINLLREIAPDIAISTDLIVGFPGEDEEKFLETMEFLKEVKFSKIHVFPYSKRKGTKAAMMANQVDEMVKKERVNRIIELDYELQNDYARKFINQKMQVIPEEYDNGYLKGHTSNYLLVNFKGTIDLIGKMVDVVISDVIFDKNLTKIKKSPLQINGYLV